LHIGWGRTTLHASSARAAITLDALPLVPHLTRSARLGPLARSDQVGHVEIAALVGLGITAALLTTLVDFRLRIPGHHIVYAMFPIALGFALVPRRLAGTVMSGAAVATVLALGIGGARTPGVGVLTGLALAGPLLDRALRWGGEGRRLYGAFVLAGALANAAAFIVRGLAKYAGVGGLAGARPFESWLSAAVWTYLIAGMAAGLLSAAAWFQLHERPKP
jgi:hypothetical protein